MARAEPTAPAEDPAPPGWPLKDRTASVLAVKIAVLQAYAVAIVDEPEKPRAIRRPITVDY